MTKCGHFIALVVLFLFLAFYMKNIKAYDEPFSDDYREVLKIDIADGVNDLFCSVENTDMCYLHVTDAVIEMNIKALDRLASAYDDTPELLDRIVRDNPRKSYSALELIYNNELRELEDDW